MKILCLNIKRVGQIVHKEGFEKLVCLQCRKYLKRTVVVRQSGIDEIFGVQSAIPVIILNKVVYPRFLKRDLSKVCKVCLLKVQILNIIQQGNIGIESITVLSWKRSAQHT